MKDNVYEYTSSKCSRRDGAYSVGGQATKRPSEIEVRYLRYSGWHADTVSSSANRSDRPSPGLGLLLRPPPTEDLTASDWPQIDVLVSKGRNFEDDDRLDSGDRV